MAVDGIDPLTQCLGHADGGCEWGEALPSKKAGWISYLLVGALGRQAVGKSFDRRRATARIVWLFAAAVLFTFEAETTPEAGAVEPGFILEHGVAQENLALLEANKWCVFLSARAAHVRRTESLQIDRLPKEYQAGIAKHEGSVSADALANLIERNFASFHLAVNSSLPPIDYDCDRRIDLNRDALIVGIIEIEEFMRCWPKNEISQEECDYRITLSSFSCFRTICENDGIHSDRFVVLFGGKEVRTEGRLKSFLHTISQATIPHYNVRVNGLPKEK